MKGTNATDVFANVGKLEGLAERATTKPEVIAKSAGELRLSLESKLAEAVHTPLTNASFRETILGLPTVRAMVGGEGKIPADWDGATQAALAMAAYRRALRDEGVVTIPDTWDRELTSMLTQLRFPKVNADIFDSPRDYKPADFQGQMRRLVETLP